MTIVKPHTLNRPLADLSQLREHPELLAALCEQEKLAILLYAIQTEETSRHDRHPNAPRMDGVVDGRVDAAA